VALAGKWNQSANGVRDFCYRPVGGVRVILRKVTAYAVEVRVRFRVKRISALAGRLITLRFGFRFEAGKGFLAVNRLHPATFQFVITVY
jgi:hypothetical protein